MEHVDPWDVICDGDRSGDMWEGLLTSIGGEYACFARLPEDGFDRFTQGGWE